MCRGIPPQQRQSKGTAHEGKTHLATLIGHQCHRVTSVHRLGALASKERNKIQTKAKKDKAENNNGTNKAAD